MARTPALLVLGREMAKKKNEIVPLRLLVKRINRKLAPTGQILIKGTPWMRVKLDYGDYYDSRLEREGDGHAHRPRETRSRVACGKDEKEVEHRRQRLTNRSPKISQKFCEAQNFIKILRGDSGFYKNCSRPERPPPLVEPPFESFDFAFEPNRLDLLYFALNLETIYDVALSAEFGKHPGRCAPGSSQGRGKDRPPGSQLNKLACTSH